MLLTHCSIHLIKYPSCSICSECLSESGTKGYTTELTNERLRLVKQLQLLPDTSSLFDDSMQIMIQVNRITKVINNV